MASPRVERASSSPFGCDTFTTAHSSFQNNTMRDNLNISDSIPNHNTEKPINSVDTWVLGVAKNNLVNLRLTRRLRNTHNENKDSSLPALVSPRHSKVIENSAKNTRQEAPQKVTTLDNKNKVHVVPNFSSRSSSFTSRRLASPPRSDGSSEGEILNLGASSLVRIWETRLCFNNKSTNNTKPNAPASLGRTSSDASSNESAFFMEEQCRALEECDGTPNTESFPNWEECDKPRPCDQSCSSQKLEAISLDSLESEKGRVANIIRRLSITNQIQSSVAPLSDDNDHEIGSVTGSLHRERDCASSTPKQQEFRAFSAPRIRGRQAYNDLLMQFESDRHGELDNLAKRGAVSKFIQRGRIRSVLRLRLLQRGVAVFDQSHLKSTTSEVNKQQRSTLTQLRESGFNITDEPRTSALTEVSSSRSHCREVVSIITKPNNNFPTSNHISKETHCHIAYNTDIHNKKATQNSMSQTGPDYKEVHPNSDVTFIKAQNNDPKEIVGASSSMVDTNANEMEHKVVTSDQQCDTAEINYDEISQEEASDQHYVSSNYDDIVEEHETNNQICGENAYDWIGHISRPRSYWEKLRQEWYKEKLNFSSENDEIRKLLERRTVSTFLSSDFRERLDRLVKSRTGTQTHLADSRHSEEDQDRSMDQLMTFFHERLHFRGNPQEDERDRVKEEDERRKKEEKDEEQEEDSIISSLDQEGDYFNQSSPSMQAPSPSSWSYRDNIAEDDSDRVASLSSSPPSQSPSFFQDTHQYSSSSSPNHHSIEMEIIYDLRAQLTQLFNEMSELKKSLKSCTDMQMQMQLNQSKKREVHKDVGTCVHVSSVPMSCNGIVENVQYVKLQ
ncbi:hypothetical protein RJT34_03927 [Clitoria ternatea]|uniref:Uncharacterized protein n=1 Tax=Clitoria ternatea TaxID=43366 RepID=A0AAN9KNU8_CLITE